MLLQGSLLLVEQLDSLRIDVLIVVWRLASHVWLLCLRHESSVAHSTRDESHGTWLLLDPKVLRWLEIVAEYRNDLLNLLVTVSVHEEVQGCLVVLLSTSPWHIKLDL